MADAHRPAARIGWHGFDRGVVMTSTPADSHEMPSRHEPHADHDGHGGHGGHDRHAGHDPEMFRRRFWLALVLTIPLVVTSEMVMDWFGYDLSFPAMSWIGPVLGSFVFVWGGWPFLVGGAREIRDRRPGMMLLISMAITVAYTASMSTSLGWFDLDFWWELGALISIMLLGHWQEMKALGQRPAIRSRCAARVAPRRADRITGDGATDGPRQRPACRRPHPHPLRRPRARRRPDHRRGS